MSPTRSWEQVILTSSKKTAWRQPPMPHAQTEQHGLKCVASLFALLYVLNFAQLVFPQMTRKNSLTARFHPLRRGRATHSTWCSDAVKLTSPWFVRSDLSGPAQCERHILSPLWWTTRIGMVTLPSQREPPIVRSQSNKMRKCSAVMTGHLQLHASPNANWWQICPHRS